MHIYGNYNIKCSIFTLWQDILKPHNVIWKLIDHFKMCDSFCLNLLPEHFVKYCLDFVVRKTDFLLIFFFFSSWHYTTVSYVFLWPLFQTSFYVEILKHFHSCDFVNFLCIFSSSLASFWMWLNNFKEQSFLERNLITWMAFSTKKNPF